jgi:hypothetical protein
MPYIVTTTSGTSLATIPDNTVNTTTTSLTLVGKNYAGYGLFLNENYIKLLENFSNSTAPSAPLVGQLWWDSTNAQLKVYTGTQWKQMGQAAASASAPSNPTTGDLWWDTTNLLLKVWSGSAWLSTGSGSSTSAGGSTTGAIADTVVDTISQSHSVVKFTIANQVIAVVSKDAVFTPQTAIPGFANIFPGINLVGTSSLSGSQFTGNSSNALAVNNISSTSFMRSDQNTSTTGTLLVTNDNGVTFGNTSTHTVSVSGGAIVLKNNTVNSDMNFFVNRSGVSTRVMSLAANSAAILPGVTNTTNIGQTSSRFNTIFGVSSSAQYADLAEKYVTDQEYPVGTVVAIGGIEEVTAARYGDRAIGVISANPAYLMNDSIKGQAVALKGRVPVLVQGAVNKGDKLAPSETAVGRASAVDKNTIEYFAIAIGNHPTGSGVVECLIL